MTYARKIDKAEGLIDFSRDAVEVLNRIRGLSPAPGAWLETALGGSSERIKVLAAEPAIGHGRPGEVLDDLLTIACGSGAIRLVGLQRAGRKAVSAAEFLRGFAVPRGAMISTPPSG